MDITKIEILLENKYNLIILNPFTFEIYYVSGWASDKIWENRYVIKATID